MANKKEPKSRQHKWIIGHRRAGLCQSCSSPGLIRVKPRQPNRLPTADDPVTEAEMKSYPYCERHMRIQWMRCVNPRRSEKAIKKLLKMSEIAMKVALLKGKKKVVPDDFKVPKWLIDAYLNGLEFDLKKFGNKE